MSIKVSKAEKLLNNESGKIKSVDILNEINDRIFSYQTKVTVAGDRIEFRKYSKLIKLNNKRLDRKKEGIRGKNGESTSRGEIDYTSRTNKRRKKEIKNLIRCNSDELKTFITLSLGNNDYKELVENKLTNSCDNFLLDNEILLDTEFKILKGIKDIRECSSTSNKKLNPKYEQLRKNIIGFLGSDKNTGKSSRIQERFTEKYEDEYEPKRLNEKIKREIPRQLNTLICNKNSYNIEDTQELFRLFNERINRYLEKEVSDVNKFKFIRTLGMQNNGKFHIHLLCNLPYIEQSKLQKKWGNGLVDIRRIKNLDEYENLNIKKDDDRNIINEKIANYFYKNIREITDNEEIDSHNHQLFSASSGLKRPLKVTSPAISDYIRKYVSKFNPKFDKNYSAENNYGIDFNMKIYKVYSRELYDTLAQKMNELVEKMIQLAKDRNQEEITQDIFDEVISNTVIEFNDYTISNEDLVRDFSIYQ